jgi:hypothetical protein
MAVMPLGSSVSRRFPPSLEYLAGLWVEGTPQSVTGVTDGRLVALVLLDACATIEPWRLLSWNARLVVFGVSLSVQIAATLPVMSGM